MKPIITTICLLGSFALIIFAIWPEYQDLRESMVEVEVKEEELNNIINYSQSIDEMTKALNSEYEEDYQKLKNGVPNDHYVPSLLSEIKDFSYQTGVRINNIGEFSQSDFSDIEDVQKIELELGVEGSYSNFKNFILSLKESARIIGFKSLSIKKKSSEDEESTLEYSLKLITYSY